MKIKSFEHVLILSDDVDATKDFFVDVIGLTVGDRPDFPFPGYWLYLGDTACVHLAKRVDPTRTGYVENQAAVDRTGTGCIDHVAFNADDCDGARARLDARGITYRHRKVPGAPLQQLFVDDPNGVTIEINFPV